MRDPVIYESSLELARLLFCTAFLMSLSRWRRPFSGSHIDEQDRSGGVEPICSLMESTTGLFRTGLIKPGRPWKTLSQVELATAEWNDWYCQLRFHGERQDTSRPSNTRPTTP